MIRISIRPTPCPICSGSTPSICTCQSEPCPASRSRALCVCSNAAKRALHPAHTPPPSDLYEPHHGRAHPYRATASSRTPPRRRADICLSIKVYQRLSDGGPAPQSAGGVAPPTPPTCQCVRVQSSGRRRRSCNRAGRHHCIIYVAYIVRNIVPTWKMPTSRSRSFPV